MASSNFFGRLSNLWSGFVSLWVSDVEKKHPEIAYENAINGLVGKYTKLKSATAAIIRRREDVTERINKERQEFEQLKADLEVALQSGQDDLAIVLIEKKNAMAKELESLDAELQQAKVDAEDAKSSLMAVKSEIGKLKAEKDRMLAKMQSAEARLQIQSQIEGISVDAEVRALDTVRDHIKNTVAEANLGKELKDSDLDSRLSELRQKSGSVSARAELENLKAARAQQAQAAKKM
ncbi:MAG: PspA/IM30 family protein [Polyangiaceae bacterium]|nr:PspA/IM30 family protein [Polyangiaceae bacterium]